MSNSIKLLNQTDPLEAKGAMHVKKRDALLLITNGLAVRVTENIIRKTSRYKPLKVFQRLERERVRLVQLKLDSLSCKKKRVTGGWVSLEVDAQVRKSIEAHMRRSV